VILTREEVRRQVRDVVANEDETDVGNRDRDVDAAMTGNGKGRSIITEKNGVI
jgi:hypothetical protein